VRFLGKGTLSDGSCSESVAPVVTVTWLLFTRCHLPCGKMVWLCTEHQKQDGATILSDEVAELNAISQDGGVNINSVFQNLTSNTAGRQKESDASRPTTAGE